MFKLIMSAADVIDSSKGVNYNSNNFPALVGTLTIFVLIILCLIFFNRNKESVK